MSEISLNLSEMVNGLDGYIPYEVSLKQENMPIAARDNKSGNIEIQRNIEAYISGDVKTNIHHKINTRKSVKRPIAI